jgi:multidrug efflux pump subunit AcrA (membrane-fusion protein)
MDIVPENPSLLIEAHVRPEDINHVRPGTAADVRLTAFNQRLTPVVSGEIQYVAADRMTSPDGKSAYYVARVRVNAQSLRDAGNLQLQAGMPAEVFVKTAARTPLEYFVDPILGFLRRSAREP